MKKVLFMLCTFFAFSMNVFGMVMIDREQSMVTAQNSIIIFDEAEYKIYLSSMGNNLKFESDYKDVVEVSEEGLLTPKKDGISLITISDDDNSQEVFVIVTKFGDLHKELDDFYNKLPDELEIKFVKGLKLYNKDVEISSGYESDYIYSAFYDMRKNGVGCYVEGDANLELAFCSIEKSWEYETESGINYQTYFHDKGKDIKIKYPEYNEEDAKEVEEFGKKVKLVYNSYLNQTYVDMFTASDKSNQELMLSATSLYKDLKESGLDYEIDARYGDDTPGQALYGGNLILGKNGVNYGVAEIEVRQVLLIPTLSKGEDLIKKIEQYFKEFFLEDDEEIKVSLKEENTYRGVITKKEETNLLSLIANFFIPKVYANEEKVVEFTIEQTNEEIVNKTNKEEVKEDINKDEVNNETSNNTGVNDNTSNNDNSNVEDSNNNSNGNSENKEDTNNNVSDNTSSEENNKEEVKEETKDEGVKDEVLSPNTLDNIITYVVLFIISIVGIIVYINKTKKIN